MANAAALAFALLEERPWLEPGAWANAAVALTTTRLGAKTGLPTHDEPFALLAKEEIRH